MQTETAAVIVAGGRGERAGGDLPKQYRRVLGEPVIRRTLRVFADHPAIRSVQPVIRPEDTPLYLEATAGLNLLTPVPGGATRQISVRAGLEALAPHKPKLVLIHADLQKSPNLHQMLSTRPYASNTASFIISDNVGCGKTVCISSSSVVSRFIATT